MTPSRAVLTTGAIAASAALGLGGCGSGASGAESGELSVVTSTNVYADIVSQVAGDFAEVTAVIDDPNQDPHSYEATTQDRLKLSKADLVVENGGGYDSFMTTMLEASGADIDTIDAVALAGLAASEDIANEARDHEHGEGDDHEHGDDEAHAGEHTLADDSHAHGDFNAHVGHSVPTMTELVDEVATPLGEGL